jgi:hypothetical protein
MRHGSRRAILTQRNPEAFLWLIPVFVAMAVFVLSEKRISELIGAAIALPLFVFFVKRPGVTLIALIIFLPLELLGFSLLLTAHVPAGILRPTSGLKELMALAILVAGLRQIRDTGRRLDRIDFAVLAYVGVVTVYLIVPHLFSSSAPTQLSPRVLAWRSDAGYPLLFFGARHAPMPPWVKERFVKVIMVIGGATALLAIFQRIDAHGWSNFVLNTAHVGTYETQVLGLSPTDAIGNLAYILTINPLRVSSLFLSPFDMGDYLVLASAVAAFRITSNRRSPFNYLVLTMSMAAIFFSRSRSDGLAAVLILILIALPTSRSPIEGRVRLIGVLVVAAVLVVPSLGGSRFVGAQGGSASASGHVTEIEDGFRVLLYYPLGLGLGDQPGTATRFAPATAKAVNPGYVSDNLVFQVGDELGFQALLPWLVFMAFVLLEFRRRASRGDTFAAALGFGLLGIVIAGLYHQVFLTYPVPWTLWAGAGLALSANQGYWQNDEARATNSYPAPIGVP